MQRNLSQAQAQSDAKQASPMAQSVGKWIHQHPNVTHGPSYFGYQYVRAALASIPYGLGMAGVLHGFSWMKHKAGIMAEAEGTRGMIGRNMQGFAGSPIAAAAQIAVAFTMYRFVGKVVKGVRNDLFDANKSEQEKVDYVDNLGSHLWEKTKHVWPAESSSTPWAALTLGYAYSHFKFSQPELDAMNKPGSWMERGKTLLAEPQKNKLLQRAAIFTVAYSAFFEIADRLFKDKQIQRGLWEGYPNSIKNAKDPIVGIPPQEAGAAVLGENGETPDTTVSNVDLSQSRVPMLTNDPSLGRLVFRRILPVAIGISAYAALKPIGYMMAGGQMKVSEELFKHGKAIEEGGKEIGHIGTFLRNSWREGFATSMFFTLWSAHDAWNAGFDKLLYKPKAQGADTDKPIDPKMAQNYEQLLARVNDKYQQQEADQGASLSH